MIQAIAWKNVWRNRSRSLVVLIAVTLGTVAGVFVAGLMNGWVKQRVAAVIYTEEGHLKVQNPAFLLNEESRFTLQQKEPLLQKLQGMPELAAYSQRSKVVAMASTARGSAGVTLKGIDVEQEKNVSDIARFIIPGTGSFFEEESRLPQVLISQKTADQLKLRNFRVSLAVYDSLRLAGVPEATLLKLDSLQGQRFLTQKKFEKAVAKLWTAREVKLYAPALLREAMYLQPRAKITFSFTRKGGTLGYQSYRVCGLYKTANTAFDQSSAFVQRADLYAAAGLAAADCHELSILLKNDEQLASVQKELQQAFPELSVMTWKELAPDAGMMADFMNVYYYMIMGIIFMALAFGIINTMLMAILERVKELGMLMAIGMTKAKVFRMIMLETTFLTLSGSLVGMLLGAILIHFTGIYGLDFSSVQEGFESMGWSAKVFPEIETSFFFGIIVLVLIISVLSSLIPARKALKLKPIEALRTE